MSAGRMFGTATFPLPVESKDLYARPRSFDLTMESDHDVIYLVIANFIITLCNR